MTKRVFFAAIVVDDEDYFGVPDQVVDQDEFASFLSQSISDDSGIEHVMVWSSIEDLLEDHVERGPITPEYVKGF